MKGKVLEYSDIVGIYNLKSFEITKPGGSAMPWRGGISKGLLIYTDDGHISVSINGPIPEDPENSKQLLDSILFYAGTARVEGDQVIHEVEYASGLDRIGKPQIRTAKLVGNTLTLTSEGKFGKAELVWEKRRK